MPELYRFGNIDVRIVLFQHTAHHGGVLKAGQNGKNRGTGACHLLRQRAVAVADGLDVIQFQMLRRDHRVKDVVYVLRHLPQISGQQCAFHGLIVRAVGNRHGVDFPVQLRRGHGEIRLADHKNAVGHVRKLS